MAHQIEARNLTIGMRVLDASDRPVTVTDCYPFRGGPLIWIELSSGTTGAVEPTDLLTLAR